MAEGEEARQPRPKAGRQPLWGVFNHQQAVRMHTQPFCGHAVGLWVGFLALHVVATDPEGKSVVQRPQHVIDQSGDGPATAGGHDHLDQPRPLGLGDEGRHPWAQAQLPCLHQGAVMGLLGCLKRLHPCRLWVDALQRPQLGGDPFAAAADGQPLAISVGIPLDVHTGLGKGPVEGKAMAVALGFGQRAVHIPKQCLQRHSATATWIQAGTGQRRMKWRCAALLLPPIAEQRWQLPQALPPLKPSQHTELIQGTGLPEELLTVLLRRGHTSLEQLMDLLEPPQAPEPEAHFADLDKAVQRLVRACQGQEPVAICGDYDADGMTSTALLMGVLQRLGARPVAAIPSRMDDGYGLNVAMVEQLAGAGIALLVTVDNGISAAAALDRAEALQVEVILTDHHTVPAVMPPHAALLHPALTPEGSPFRGLAGVGLAYVLAAGLCRAFADQSGLDIALNLFCIGTIADMAPLQGVNRRWLCDGLPRLGHSALPGLQALQQLSGLDDDQVDAQAVGFQLAPRINAVGRLGDPQLVVELLTTSDPARAMELARQCETLNRQRRELCDAIEAEALALLDADGPLRPPFLLLAQTHWHHGVIGIVAARLVERFGRPAALLAGEGQGQLRASVRAPKGFAVDAALQHCASLLQRFGGHPAAGGFTVKAEQVAALHAELNTLAATWMQRQGAGVSIEPEALLELGRIDRSFWHQLQRLEPFGIAHAAPVFWSRNCTVHEQKLLRGGHLQLLLSQGGARLRAMGWRWQGETELPAQIDVAYRLRLDRWQGEERLQLELVGLRAAAEDSGEVVLQRHARTYWCRRDGDQLVVRNAAGEELVEQLSDLKLRSLKVDSESKPAGPLDPRHNHPYVRTLMREAAMALGLAS